MELKKYDEKYAELILKQCLPGKTSKPLVIQYNYKELEPFAKIIEEKAKELGYDEIIHFCPDYENLLDFFRWKKGNVFLLPEQRGTVLEDAAINGASFIMLCTEHRDEYCGEYEYVNYMFEDYKRQFDKDLRVYYNKMGSFEMPWTEVFYPNPRWAKKIYPNLSAEEAYEKLYMDIISSCYCDKENPLKEWQETVKRQKEITDKLNDLRIQRVHLTNSIGTDLKLVLPEEHVWNNGVIKDAFGRDIMPNMPAFGIYTAPRWNDVDGVVRSTMPTYTNQKIGTFGLSFKDGKVETITAENEHDKANLNNIIFNHQGMQRLGEISLIEEGTPVGMAGNYFSSNVLDEHRSTHLGLGYANPLSCKDGLELDNYDLKFKGFNTSNYHLYFMIGTPDLQVEADTKDGKKLIYSDGKFTL